MQRKEIEQIDDLNTYYMHLKRVQYSMKLIEITYIFRWSLLSYSVIIRNLTRNNEKCKRTIFNIKESDVK